MSNERASVAARPALSPLGDTSTFADRAYLALKDVIVSLDVYGQSGDVRLDEYAEVNIEFHQTIISMSRNTVLINLAENLFTHMRMIRRQTIGEEDRADRSIRDHLNIIQALEARDTARAEELVRAHALGLADHVARHADYLDQNNIREATHG